MYSYGAFLRINSVKMQQRRGKYIEYIVNIYLLLHLLKGEKRIFERFFERRKRKRKSCAQKKKRKPTKRKLLAGLHSWLHEKGQKPFPFCRWYTTVWFLSRLTILNITIERLGISSGSIVTSRAITSSTLLKPTSVSSATFCPL